MSNERNKFRADYERLYDTCPRGYIVETGEYTNDHAAHAWLWFQAGAAYQREQVKGLVEALEAFDVAAKESTTIIGFAGKALKLLTNAREALATYRAAQGEKP